MTSSSEGCHEIEAAKLHLSVAKRQVVSTKKLMTSANDMCTDAKSMLGECR